jgi:uncharacterized protein
MKIPAGRIPPSGLTIEESMTGESIGLDRESVCLSGPIKAVAKISKITNALTIDLSIEAKMVMTCSRCLFEFEEPLQKQLQLSFSVESSEQELDLSGDIREELLFAQPLKILCRPECKGLCSRCGKNLNDGQCNCDTNN